MILEGKDQRNDAIQIVRSEGGQVLQDSGGRAIVVETGQEEEKIRIKLPQRARISQIEEDIRNILVNPDPTESLFLDALNLRNSASYRSAKRNRKPPGEEPEEIELLSGSCTGDE